MCCTHNIRLLDELPDMNKHLHPSCVLWKVSSNTDKTEHWPADGVTMEQTALTNRLIITTGQKQVISETEDDGCDVE